MSCQVGGAALACILLLAAATAAAGEPAATEKPAPATPAPYSLPFQLRSVLAATNVRSDTAFALYHDAAGNRGFTTFSSLLFAWQVYDRGRLSIAPLTRLALVHNDAPGTTPGGTSIVSPVVGAAASVKLPADLRFNLFLGVTIPVGMGGGDHPDPGESAATRAGVLARSAMDNALFAVNDLVVFPGGGLAWIRSGWTLQVEFLVLLLTRVRGAETQKDAFKVNFTTGFHVGYFVIPQLSLGAELRYQTWFTTPAAVAADPTGALRNTLSIAVGPRGHFHFGGRMWLRPAIVYATGLDNPMRAQGYHIIQLDVPFYF